MSQKQEPEEQELCKVCSGIDFDRYLFHHISRKILLGTWLQLVQRSFCPFCRLVLRALTSGPSCEPWQSNHRFYLTNDISWMLGIEKSPYDSLKSDAYSNKYDLRSVAKSCEKVAYRLVVISSHRRQYCAYIQYICPSSRGTRYSQFFGRQVARNRVESGLLRRWLQRCEEYHQDICQEDGVVGRRLPGHLRLIDVENRVLVRFSGHRTPPYTTLSYVWGVKLMEQATGRRPITTSRSDLRRNDNGEEISPLQDGLPRTIEDAIWLTAELGYQYLWVDAICIVQDESPELKEAHLLRMDAVYNCSELTIVAASGAHADSGLPGISIPRRHAPVSENIGSHQLSTMSPSFSELENSRSLVWNTRGWTFQEKIFAKRILLFTEYQVYYRCSESIWTEEITMETQTPSKSVETRKAKFRWAADREWHTPSLKLQFVKVVLPSLDISDEWSYLGRFPDYAAAVREYSLRELSDNKDILMAVNGILRSLEADNRRLICGIPETHLLQSLLWHSKAGSPLIRANEQLPSWTWASWQAETGILYDVLDIRLLRIIVLAIRSVLSALHRAARQAKQLSKASTSSSSSHRPSGNSGSSSDYYGTGCEGATSSSTPSSSSSSSAPLIPPPIFPPTSAPMDWTSFKAARNATMNIMACFLMPLFFRDHTAKDVFLYEDGKAHPIRCEEPLNMTTLIGRDEDPMRSERVSTGRHGAAGHAPRFHDQRSALYQGPVLSMKSSKLKLRIGKCLQECEPGDAEEIGVYQLVDDHRRCIGEAWTTHGVATRGRKESLDFLTISWGLSLTVAKISKKYLPRWTFDAEVLPTSKTKRVMTACKLVEEFMSWNSGKHLSATYGGVEGSLSKDSSGTQRPSLMSFFDALLTAKNGKPLPKFLWSTVNVLLVDRSDRDGVSRRLGVGRIIFGAWLRAWTEPDNFVIG